MVGSVVMKHRAQLTVYGYACLALAVAARIWGEVGPVLPSIILTWSLICFVGAKVLEGLGR